MSQKFAKIIVLLSGSLLLITQPGASCISDTSSDGNAPRDDRSPPRDEDESYVPQRADIVREGRGTLRYTADADGTIYVQNLRRDRTEIQRRVHRGQVIEVLPEDNRIRIDDETVSKTDLKSEDTHRIYLLRDRRFENDRDNGRNDRDEKSDRDDRNPSARPPRCVPSTAQLMGDGRNKEISFRPSKSGNIYIYSVEDRKVVSRLSVRDGQRFVLSPGRRRAAIDGKAVEQNVFNGETTYRVYFNREG